MEFFAKKKQLVQALDDYSKEVNKTMECFEETMTSFFEGKTYDEMEELCKKVRKSESKCDTYRRDIEHQLYAGAMMPGSRGDIFNLLEALDKVPNKAEDVCNYIVLVGLEVPQELHEDLKQIIDLDIKCVKKLTAAVSKLFQNLNKAHEEAHVVEEIETESDKLERRLIRRIFQLDIPHGHRLMLRELVTGLGAIADRAENASDRIEIMAIKRKT